MTPVPRAFRLPVLAALLLAASASPRGEADGSFQLFSLSPCRVFDTRQVSAQTNGQPLPNPGPHLFRVQGQCGVPVGAAAVAANVTVVTPTQFGDLRLAPADIPAPNVSTLNYRAGEHALANGAIVPLSDVQGPNEDDLAVRIGMLQSGTVHLIFDVTGYFQ